MEHSETLMGYSILIEKIREFESKNQTGKTITRTERIAAMQEAVKWCIGNGVLKEFLEQHSGEVINMLYEEWDLEKFGAMQREEGIEIGREEGEKIRAMEVARRLLKRNRPVDEIIEDTGLTLKEIESLRQK